MKFALLPHSPYLAPSDFVFTNFKKIPERRWYESNAGVRGVVKHCLIWVYRYIFLGVWTVGRNVGQNNAVINKFCFASFFLRRSETFQTIPVLRSCEIISKADDCRAQFKVEIFKFWSGVAEMFGAVERIDRNADCTTTYHTFWPFVSQVRHVHWSLETPRFVIVIFLFTLDVFIPRNRAPRTRTFENAILTLDYVLYNKNKLIRRSRCARSKWGGR